MAYRLPKLIEEIKPADLQGAVNQLGLSDAENAAALREVEGSLTTPTLALGAPSVHV